MMNKKLIKILIFTLFLLLLFSAIPGTIYSKGESKCPTGKVCLDDPLGMKGDPKAPQKLIGKVINAILGIVGSLALAMFIFGGFTWMTAAGNAEKVKKGKDILVWATLGLVIIFSSYALVKFVFTSLGV